MSTDYLSSGTTISTYDVTIAIPGDVETVRSRLINALQTLGYRILGEQPIYARRAAQGPARCGCSINVLDHPTTLTTSLKQTNDVAVVATFSYEIKSYMRMTKGDKQTLLRETEAMTALATERRAISACSACGTQVTDESHFCRRCGAPLVVALPELEVLRLTRGSRASYHHLVFGLVALVLASLTILPAFVVNGARIYAPLLWVGIPLASYGLFVLLQGVAHLHRTLNPAESKDAVTAARPAFNVSVTTALPPAAAKASVTEGTTELLIPINERQTAEPVRRKDADTAEIDSERVM